MHHTYYRRGSAQHISCPDSCLHLIEYKEGVKAAGVARLQHPTEAFHVCRPDSTMEKAAVAFVGRMLLAQQAFGFLHTVLDGCGERPCVTRQHTRAQRSGRFHLHETCGVCSLLIMPKQSTLAQRNICEGGERSLLHLSQPFHSHWCQSCTKTRMKSNPGSNRRLRARRSSARQLLGRAERDGRRRNELIVAHQQLRNKPCEEGFISLTLSNS